MQERRRGKERRNDKEEKQLLRPEPSHLAVSRAVMLDIKTHDYHSQLNRDVIKDARRGLA